MSLHKNIEHCLYTPKNSPRYVSDTSTNQAGNPDGVTINEPIVGIARNSSDREILADGIPMGKGMMLKIRTIPYAFTLPHRYHERLEYTLGVNHPENRILLNRRVGYLGAANPVRYSILAYLENPTDFEVTVAGAALNNAEAWSFNTLILLKDLGIGIAKTLEHIAALPIHTPIDFNCSGEAPDRG